MLEKIWIISLTLIALFSEVRLEKPHYLDTDKTIDVNNATTVYICVHINEDLKKDDTFYIIVSSEEKGAKLNKTIYYQFQTGTCEYVETPMNFNGFQEVEGSYDTSNSDTLYNEFKIKKSNDNYMIAVLKDGNGKNIKVAYAKISPVTLLIILGCSIAGGVVLIIVITIIICCCLCRRKKVAAVQQQYQSSFVNEPIVPE